MTLEESQIVTSDLRTRKISIFSWSEVDPEVIRSILKSVYEKDVQIELLSRLQRFSDRQLILQAEMTLGAPPAKRFDEVLVDVAVQKWLEIAPARAVKELATIVQAAIKGEARYDYIRDKSSAMSFLFRRKRTRNFEANVRKSFIAAHKITYEVPAGPQSTRGRRRGPVALIGKAESAEFTPYQHQVEAREALDGFFKVTSNRKKGGLIVLPTGAGKTEVMVEWLLDRIENNEEARVLWISHQQELLDQSIRRFVKQALLRPEGFKRTARAIHGRASEKSTLTIKTLDIAAITFQSLVNITTGPGKAILAKYFSRPVYVVVDEVHHAGAKSFRKVIAEIMKHRPLALVGLTATPAPTSLVNRYHLNEHFPEVVYRASIEDLIARKILSKPILNTVTTRMDFVLDEKDLAQAEYGDLSPRTLRGLETEARDALIVNAWKNQNERWGKTLVFATSIMHAEGLLEAFQAAGANAMALHSRTGNRQFVLSWFRAEKKTAVLISVGMLTEGVDLPSARTAFLARPTTSRTLLKQMIGRVMRGPRAGGEETAELVYFADSWSNFLDIIGPDEVLPEGYEVSNVEQPQGAESLPPLLEDDKGETLASKVVAQALRQLQEAAASRGEQDDRSPIDTTLYSNRLIGHYDMEGVVLPVFEHQKRGFTELVKLLKKRKSLRGLTKESFFEDTHPPYPSARGLREFTAYVLEFSAEPPFCLADALIGPEAAVERILEAGPITEAQRAEIIRSTWGNTISRIAYASLLKFEEAVERELRARRQGEKRLDPEEASSKKSPSGLPKIPGADRKLKPLVEETLQIARRVVPEHRLEVLLTDVPPVAWTSRVVGSTFGHWSIKLYGKNRGRQLIRINRLLRSPRTVIPDEVICFIIFHELLHHALPGQGHDSEFRELEHLFPEAIDQMAFLATLHEKYDLEAEVYRR